MRICRFCGAILGDKGEKFCHACGIVAPHPELAVEFFGRIVIGYTIAGGVVGCVIGVIGLILWPNNAGGILLPFITSVIGLCIGWWLGRNFVKQTDMEQQIFAFHRLNPNAYRMSGTEVARMLKLPGLEKQIAKTVDTMKHREELCRGTDPTDPRRQS